VKLPAGAMHKQIRPYINNWEDLLLKHSSPVMRQQILNKSDGTIHVDLILTDTEGQDLNVLKMVNFTQIRPTCYFYERKILNQQDQEEAERILKHAGYTIRQLSADNLACRVRVVDT
jgi:hypothetical protein